MKVTQGCFSFLPDLSDEQIAQQVEYCLRQEWSIGIEYTDDAAPPQHLLGHVGKPHV